MRQFLQTLAISLATVSIGMGVGFWFVQNQLATRPSIAVIDYGPIANAIALGISPDEIQPYLSATKTRVTAYQDAGYVVINNASIDAAPEDVYVPPLGDIPEAWLEPSVAPASTSAADIGTPTGEVSK